MIRSTLATADKPYQLTSAGESTVTCVQEEKKPDEAGVRIGHNDLSHSIHPFFDAFSSNTHLVSV